MTEDGFCARSDSLSGSDVVQTDRGINGEARQAIRVDLSDGELP